MAHVTRQFTVAELEALGFPSELDEGVELEDTLIDKRRWYENRRLIFRHEGQVWAVPYAREYQDDSGVEWHHNARGGIVTATAMTMREATVSQWAPVIVPLQRTDAPSTDQ